MNRTLFLAFLPLFLLFSCKSQSIPAVDDLALLKNRNTITFGVKVDAPPFGMLVNGEHVGFDVDIAKAVAAKMGLKANFVGVKSSERIPFLLEGKVDAIIASMTVSRTREQDVDFSIPYFQDGQALLCRSDSDIQSYQDLKGRKIGAVKGSTSHTNMLTVQPEGEMVLFADYDEAVQALIEGKIDTLTSDYLILSGLSTSKDSGQKLEIRGTRFTIEPYGIALREDQSDLRDAINLSLMSIWADQIWHSIFVTWFGPGSRFETEIDFSITVIPQ
ncbi:MAG: transporter substrate-binding domain-containing protein [Planctomycetes bacterium]|nr:transporter substrate-binding domain-containing protein [Planctomycetota bacterium]